MEKTRHKPNNNSRSFSLFSRNSIRLSVELVALAALASRSTSRKVLSEALPLFFSRLLGSLSLHFDLFCFLQSRIFAFCRSAVTYLSFSLKLSLQLHKTISAIFFRGIYTRTFLDEQKVLFLQTFRMATVSAYDGGFPELAMKGGGLISLS